MINLPDQYIFIHPEVKQALEDHMPVVALESTVITHGLPFPENQRLALDLEAEIRGKGCVPATIAILDGRIHVGLDQGQIERLSQDKNLVKVSSRDIAPSIIQNRSGGTTVAGTLAIAEKAGIKVFATGGIGGVHRGSTFDVSADLRQLAQSPLIVVCAGVKAILDIPATLEVLETYGVPIVGYQTDEFPAFYTIGSGEKVSARADTTSEVVKLAMIHWTLGLKTAILLAVPAPVAVAMDAVAIESAIQQALNEHLERKIHGQAVTPFMLSRVSELTMGKSLRTNLELLKNNARVAAGIALAMQTFLS
jgi:pseudouridine-5'-phosphate glycosidase